MISKHIVLILGKDLSEAGGINNYFRLFLNYFNHKSIEIKYFTFGLRRSIKKNRVIKYVGKYLKDIILFSYFLIRNKNIKLVHLNSSLVFLPIVRDSGLFLISKFFKKKVIFFIHGWKLYFVQFLERCSFCKFLFVRMFSASDKIIVLAEDFKKTLINWGLEKEKIHVSKMMFDGSLFHEENNQASKTMKFLFLGRLQDNKGIFDILEALLLLKKNGYDFHFSFVGNPVDGKTLDNLKNRVKYNKLNKHISIKGYVKGKEKTRQFNNADVFVFPSYTEGCPNAVLEAMAAGLFIISTDVGALKEIVIDGENGFIVRIGNVRELAEKIKKAIMDCNFVKMIGEQNRIEAFEKYEVNKILWQIKEIYIGLLK